MGNVSYVTATYLSPEGESEASNHLYIAPTITQPPAAPSNLTISVIAGNVELAWDEVIGATSYKVYSSDRPDQDFTEDNTGVYENTNWTAPVPATTKYYHVKAMILRDRKKERF